MTLTIWAALAIVVVTVYALIRRYETRIVLLASGLAMTIISLDPMAAFRQFDKSMTNGSLIIAICSAMGFAAVVSLTKCDSHLVALLTRPLKKMGVLLLPACMVVTSFIATAIPSYAGLAASVGPTMIPILVRAGFRPSIAAASVAVSILLAYLNPGVSHNPFIAKLAGIEVIDFIAANAMTTVLITCCGFAILTAICFLYGDYKREGFSDAALSTQEDANLPEKPNVFFAIAPLIPVAILVCGSIWAPQMKISVATAMLVGMIYAMAVTRTNPEAASKKFFEGMGKGYGSILGIIIAAGVFAAGLRAAGVIDLFVNFLTNAREIAKIGGSAGPFILGVLTGSGDAVVFFFI